MKKRKYVASCPNCGQKVCFAADNSEVQVKCSYCKTLVDVEIVKGKVIVEEAKEPVVLPISDTI